MKKFTLILSLLVAMVTTAMAQKAHQRISHEGWVVTALNESSTSGNEGGTAFIQDDNASTFYHSDWGSYYDGRSEKKGGDGVQAFMVDLSEVKTDISLMTYKGRSDDRTSGWARGVRVYVYETLPTNWPANGLSSLSYDEKEALLASTNTEVLGEPAFNSNNQLWANDRTTKLVELATPQSGRYVLFVMDSGYDQWLTCSDFQIYQYTAYSGITSGSAYNLQITNAAATGTLYIDTYTGISETAGNTIGFGETSVATYFIWNTDGWLISTNEAGDGNFLKTNKWCANPQQAEGSNWEILVNDDSSISLLQGVYDGGSDNSRCFLGGDFISNASVVKLFTDNEKGKAANIKLISASAAPVTVKYIYKYNGETKVEEEISSFIGEEYPTPSYSFPYGVSATVPTGEIEENDAVEGVVTKEITLNIELPFEPAETAENIEKWYYLKFDSNNSFYLHHDAGQNYIDLDSKAVDASNKDNYTWAFVGNPFEGYKIVNKAAGEGYILSSSTTMAGTTGADTWPIMTEEATLPEGNNTYWIATSSTHTTNGFYLAQKDFPSNRMNNRGKLAYWTDGAGAGSTFWVEERDMSGATELQALIDAIKAKNYVEGTTVGYIKSLAELNEAIASAEQAVENKTACDDAQVALQAAEDALETIQPEEGKFYTIKNCHSGVYMNVDNTATMTIANTAAMGEVFQFVAAGDNKFYLYNIERGTYLNTAKVHAGGVESAAATSTENAKAVTIKNLTVEDRVSITPNGGATMHHDANYNNVVGWNGDANSRSAWKIEEVDATTLAHSVTVSDAGYATLYLNYAVTIPEGVEVYGVTEATNGWAMMDEISGTIPAKTGVILKNAGTFAFNYSNNASEATSILKGTLLDENREEDAYVLGIVNETVGMYLAAKNQAENTAFKNNAFKAYLVPEVKENIASYSFNFDWNGTTGIENIEDAVEENATKAIYDITGRQIKAITVPGIYIINGKKTFVK